ncbi:MAG: helix-turn-helix domain-containing protein [Prevotellaceae bacterium]|nr:helix-turn-helix domain-containing protein [Prevotellaceae bacterium]
MIDISKEKELLCKHMSKILPALRASLQLSQTELGEYVSVSRQTISEIERGEYHMSWNQFTSFYMVFGSNTASHEVLEENGLSVHDIAPAILVTKCKDTEEENNQVG